MARNTVKTMSKTWLNKIKFRGDEPKCHLCRGTFQLGDSVVTRYTNTKIKLFHIRCWDSMYIVTEDQEEAEENVFTQPRTETIK